MVKASTTEDKEMHSLCKTCPTCGFDNPKRLESKDTFMPEDTAPHYVCPHCGTLWGVGRPKIEKSCGKQAS